MKLKRSQKEPAVARVAKKSRAARGEATAGENAVMESERKPAVVVKVEPASCDDSQSPRPPDLASTPSSTQKVSPKRILPCLLPFPIPLAVKRERNFASLPTCDLVCPMPTLEEAQPASGVEVKLELQDAVPVVDDLLSFPDDMQLSSRCESPSLFLAPDHVAAFFSGEIIPEYFADAPSEAFLRSRSPSPCFFFHA